MLLYYRCVRCFLITATFFPPSPSRLQICCAFTFELSTLFCALPNIHFRTLSSLPYNFYNSNFEPSQRYLPPIQSSPSHFPTLTFAIAHPYLCTFPPRCALSPMGGWAHWRPPLSNTNNTNTITTTTTTTTTTATKTN